MNNLTTKLAYLGIGGLICSILSALLILQEPVLSFSLLGFSAFAAVAVFGGCVFKEYFASDKFTWSNIIWAMIGCVISIASFAAGIALHGATV